MSDYSVGRYIAKDVEMMHLVHHLKFKYALDVESH